MATYEFSVLSKLLGSVPFLKLSTPGVLRSDLAHNHQVHKRFDPIYNDARQRIQNLGTFGYLLVAHWGVGVGELVPLNLDFYGYVKIAATNIHGTMILTCFYPLGVVKKVAPAFHDLQSFFLLLLQGR